MRRLMASGLLATALLMPAPAQAALHSTLPSLLDTWVEIQEDPTQWGTAWLRYEAAHSAWLDQAFYGLYPPDEKSKLLESFLQRDLNGLPSQMHALGSLYQGFSEDFEAVRDGLSREFGRAPNVEVYLLYAAAPQTVTFATIAGKPSLSFNARLLLPYETASLRAQLARQLFPFVMNPPPLGLAGRSVRSVLQTETLAVLAADRVVPGQDAVTLLQLAPEELSRLMAGQRDFARELLLAMDSKDAAQVGRFFGAQPPAGWPARTGRYLGLLIGRELVKEARPAALMALDEQAFGERAKRALKKLAGG